MTRKTFVVSFALAGLLGAFPAHGLFGATAPKNATLKTADGPLVQAHRGGRYEWDDNARGGFVRSLARGVRGFELDIRFSKDHRLIVMHDGTVDRTTNGSGPAEAMTLDQLRALRLEACSEPVPAAEDVLAVFSGREDIFVELEMKAYPGGFYTPAVLEAYCRALNALAKKMLRPGTYSFTCFNTGTLEMMRRVDPRAPLGLIVSSAITEEIIARAKKLDCCSLAASGSKTPKEMIARAHAEGLSVCLWMCSSKKEWAAFKEKGADRVTSDYPVLLTESIAGKRKKMMAFDLDATLSQHRLKPPQINLDTLKKLQEKYVCVMVGAGNAPRIFKQMGNYPIEIIGNYGMQIASASDGELRIVKAVTNKVDEALFLGKCQALREKYGYTAFAGKSAEFHPSGMVTFALIGTEAAKEDKIAFDPDRKKRRAMYADVLAAFKGYSCYIGGSTSFDIAGGQYNKYDATLAWAKERGFGVEDIVFVGDDFADGGGDSHVRIKGMDYVLITDYRRFPKAMAVLLD